VSKKNNKRGKQSRYRRHNFVSVTKRATHHFIVCHPDLTTTMKDDAGRVLVYTKREQAEAAAKTFGFVIVGMGDEKWALFRSEELHVIVPET
jgi:hypothetical protein